MRACVRLCDSFAGEGGGGKQEARGGDMSEISIVFSGLAGLVGGLDGGLVSFLSRVV